MELDYGPVRVVDESADTAFVIFFFFNFYFINRAYNPTFLPKSI